MVFNQNQSCISDKHLHMMPPQGMMLRLVFFGQSDTHIFLPALAGMFYGVLINDLDQGKTEHQKYGGFWGRKTNVSVTPDKQSRDFIPEEKPILVRKGILKGKTNPEQVGICSWTFPPQKK